ncbi:MAG: hypothetical protein ACD_75C00048G0001 [uncultured bacterium]|nr:MAG: hypothetical protein ACD_75C00048G0001 [uncultured bacterium]
MGDIVGILHWRMFAEITERSLEKIQIFKICHFFENVKKGAGFMLLKTKQCKS